MTEWYPTIKTIKGRHYLYLQRTWREDGRVRSQSQYVGPIDVSRPTGEPEAPIPRRPKRSRGNQVAMAVFGVEDEYARRVDSLWNRYVNKEKAVTEVKPQKGGPPEPSKSQTDLPVVDKGDDAVPPETQPSLDPATNRSSGGTEEPTAPADSAGVGDHG